MTDRLETRTYLPGEAIVFRKTKEAFGGLSNMAGGFPIEISGHHFRTSEALYQACRFPHLPDIQELIASQRSPMTAKMKSKPYRKDSRPDWNQVRVPIMKWCLRVKLLQNWKNFSHLLLETGDSPIVEFSKKDGFWGAKPNQAEALEGVNVLGRLLMELREKLKSDPGSIQRVEPVSIDNFLLFDEAVPALEVGCESSQSVSADESEPMTRDLFSSPPEPKKNKPATEIEESCDMTSTYKKKLIEVAIPLEAINAASAREKSIRHGHPSTMHLWWARRPLAACRAVLFAQLVDDPSSHPDMFPTNETVEAERKRLFKIIEDLVKWENSTNEEVLEQARAEIRKSCEGELPPVYDPFSGGGSIPLEAQRLGLPAYGSDLNPVAVLIGKAMIEIPPKFKDLEPVHPGGEERNHYRNAEGLAEDIRHYGLWMRERAEERIGHLYPKIKLPKEYGNANVNVMAWIWARTVRTPNPALKGKHVPIVKSFKLGGRSDRVSWIKPIVDTSRNEYSFDIVVGGSPAITSTSGRRNASCLMTGDAIPIEYIQEEGKNGRLGRVLIAIVAEGPSGKVYLPPNEEHDEIEKNVDLEIDLGTIDHWRSCTNCVVYGLDKFDDLHTPRELLALNTFADLLDEVEREVGLDASNRGWSKEDCTEYSTSLRVYLGLAVSKAADKWNSMTSWDNSRQSVSHLFTRQAIPMVWDYAETNPFSGSAGNWTSYTDWIAKVVEKLVMPTNGVIYQHDAATTDEKVPPSVVSTDPPYYDNVPYSNLSDFFYPWMKRAGVGAFPELFSTLQSPKMPEIVANQFRFGGKDAASQHFIGQMKLAMRRMSSIARDNFPLTIYYAFKQSEIKQEGEFSRGWADFLSAVIEAGLEIHGTWPVRTELSNRMMGIGNNALASSVVLSCRKSAPNQEIITRAEFVRALKRELPKAISKLQASNIAPADMPQSAIGPGMGVFSRYKAVLEADDTPMSVKMALQLINRELDEFLNDIQGEFDADTRFAITWFEQNGYTNGEFGVANNIAQARGIAVDSVKQAGIIESSAGKVRILKRDELLDDWDPATDTHLTVWECCQYLIRAIEDEGEHAAALLIRRLGSEKAEAVKDLAYCLYDLSSNKRNDAKEAISYNALIAIWADLTRMAATINETRGDDQASLDL